MLNPHFSSSQSQPSQTETRVHHRGYARWHAPTRRRAAAGRTAQWSGRPTSLYGDFLLILLVFYEVLWDCIGILGGFYKIFPPPTESDLKEPILLQTHYSDSLPMYIILIFFFGSRTQPTLLPDQFSRSEWVTNFTIKSSCHPGGFSSNGLRSARYASCRCPFPPFRTEDPAVSLP